MARYIDKDALVAEIEELYKEHSNRYECDEATLCLDVLEDFIDTLEVKEIGVDLGDPKGDKSAKHIIDTKVLEVKEVDLDYIKDELDRVVKIYKPNENFCWGTLYNIATHFFELGLKAKNWKKERMEECPYRRVECTMYEGRILECKGACSWVVDYPKLKELNAQKGE